MYAEIQIFVLIYFIMKCSLLTRQPTQDAPEEVRARDFRRELEEKERVAAREKTRERGPRGWSIFRDLLNVFICCFFTKISIYRKCIPI